MTDTSAQSAPQQLRRAARHATPWIALLARAGYTARGVVYCLIGALAMRAAIGERHSTPGAKGALLTLLEHRGGQVILALIALGFLGYALWCFVQALRDPEGRNTRWPRLLWRAVMFCTGLVYLGMLAGAVRLLVGYLVSIRPRDWTAWVMSFPAGIWLVAAVGVGTLIFGLQQIHAAWAAKLEERLVLGALPPPTRHAVVQFCRFGLAARGAVFGIIGAFLILAALHADPGETKGIGGALGALHRQPYGPWLLGIVAVGLIAFGLYQFLLARYRRIRPA